MLPPLDILVHLSADEIVLTVPRFSVTVSQPVLIAVLQGPDGSRAVYAVGRGARGLPDASPDPREPGLLTVVNPLQEGRRGLELLEAMMEYHLRVVLGMTPWWANALTSVRVSVTTEGVARDEATLDTIAVGLGSPKLAVTIDGHPWHGPSPHHLKLPRTRRERAVILLFPALGAFLLWHPSAHHLRELLQHSRAAYALGCVLALQMAHAAWWHARQQRRRASQRARLSAAVPSGGSPE
jgi:hypothetical protein